MFYEFRQNNSGGSFVIDEDRGLSIHVIIEADNYGEAEWLAELTGIYFDGCDDGTDCDCCGDRWSRLYDETGDSVPSYYGQPIDESKADRRFNINWSGERPEAFIHYKDGRVEPVYY